jgi:alpha-glucosidase
MFGKIKSFEHIGNKIKISFDKKVGEIEVINPYIINVFVAFKRDEHFSRAIEGEKTQSSDIKVSKYDDRIEILTEALKILVHDNFKVDFFDKDGILLCEDYRGGREPFIRRGNGSIAEGEGHKIEKNNDEHKIEVIKTMMGNEYFYGFGDKTGPLNKHGYGYEMWNTDDPSPHVESHKSLYKSIPFFITLREKQAFGIFFDNTFKSQFDMGKENSNYYYFGANDGNLDYYFISGPKITDILDRYTYLTGKTPLPQKWTLGYQQCRWSYGNESRVMEIAENFRKKDIPCDVIYLDIDYMDGYRVFTWDKEKFEDPKLMIKKLKEMGFKLVTIIDPGVKKDKGYHIYDEGIKNNYFATDKDGVPYVNEVWPGDSLYPDFSKPEVRAWWSENQKIIMDAGVEGIWNDMNEPASFRGPLPDDVMFDNDGRLSDHTEVHNVYGHLMSMATFEGIKKHTEKRPFVITRACYAGTQKYSTAWTGDNQSFWEHLRLSIPMLMNLGLSGLTFCGTDVGGFSSDCTSELLSRWVQVGCFSPLFRNHSAIHTRDQEPWAFDEITEEINRKYIKLRYKLMPYLYDMMWTSENTGLPVIRPLMLHYQQDEKTYEINDEFMFGEDILVAPVLEQGQKARTVYLPQGTWVDYWTKEVIQGGRYVLRETPLDVCPIFIKSGSIIPNYHPQNYIGEYENKNLILDVYFGNGNYVHYQDDGESFKYKDGEYNLYEFTMETSNEMVSLNINNVHNNYKLCYESFTFNINNFTASEILVDGETIHFETYKDELEWTTFTVLDGSSIIKIS